MRVFYRLLTMVAMAAACAPSFGDRPWKVQDARILAIAVTPAEARPGEGVDLEALVVGPAGTAAANVEWSWCTQARTAEERTAVTESCAGGESLEPVVSPALVLFDACARFGPNPPPNEGDQLARRPADPDPSGGYFLPAGAYLRSEPLRAFGFVRLRCDLAGVTRAIFDEYEARYTLNLNPQIESTTEAVHVAPGATVELELVAAAGSSEAYVVYDEANARLLDRREALHVRWYVTDGELGRAEQTREGSETGDGSAQFWTDWQAPSEVAQVFGWAVITDDRGGTAWVGFEVDVS
jgi:hypothetical protein